MVTHVKTESALERFVSATHQLFESEPDLEKRWAALSPILDRLLCDPEVLEASRHWPDCIPKQGRAENLIFYEDPEYGFAVNGLTKGVTRRAHEETDRERQTSGPQIHDHAHIYTLYGVLSGHERIERYERLDDRSVTDLAEIRKIRDDIVGPGEIDLVKPYEIHREISVGETSIAIIVRSEKSGGFNQGCYDLDTNHYWEGLGPIQTPCEMFSTTNS